DGLLNGFELGNGLDPLSFVGNDGADGDPDGDGLNNVKEFLSGTSPTNSASAFRITAIAREGNNLRVTWVTGPNKTNALQRATGGGFATNNFVNIFTVT